MSREKVKAELSQLLSESAALLDEGKSYLLSKGVVFDMTDWVTVKEYCKRFGIENTETVSNWIRRGIIPKEDMTIIEEFNNTRLIRAKKYHVKAETSA